MKVNLLNVNTTLVESLEVPGLLGESMFLPKSVFFVEVFHRTSETLKAIFLENVLPGTTIITDEWRGYWGLEGLGYFHATVNQ
ncbi:hypothetical protein H312_03175 [Anncaliia algerae PRA339]|uniref:ISXO2-like transposase domain-containing protein n=1 Tax=Anncaliia algerae PRA339 TaxID=1288291 RepID=A0A059EXF1_9MICR|nr:hypothetical protein H312_03175 [Anncaliia algerae PRA339]